MYTYEPPARARLRPTAVGRPGCFDIAFHNVDAVFAILIRQIPKIHR